jgi:flagellar protein FliO/FliZ
MATLVTVHAQSDGTSAPAGAVNSTGVQGDGSDTGGAASQQYAPTNQAEGLGPAAGQSEQQSDRIDESQLTFEYADDEDPAGISSSDDPQALGTEPIQVFGFWDLMRMILVLVIVVAMIYGVYFLLRRSKKAQVDDSSFISVLSSQTLPGGKQLHIIDVAGQVYLLGAGDAGINMITEITDKPTIDELRLQASRRQVQGANFSRMLSGFFTASGSGAEHGDRDEAGDDVASIGFDFVRQQRERLKKL